MRGHIRWAGVLALVGVVAWGGDDARPKVKVATADGKAVPVLPEDLTGLTARPLVKTRDALDKKFRKGFYSLYRVQTKVGTELVGEYDVTTVPCRLTVYEVTKRGDADRELRVVATGYHDKPGKAVFRKKIETLEENVFFITVEQVTSAKELNSHLRYMESQGNEILLKGYGTNWSLSALRLKMAGKTEGPAAKEDKFEKDAFWLIDQFLNPLWLISLRIETED